MTNRYSRLRNQRGAALAYVVAIAAILTMTAAGVDLAHLAFTASEVQNAADIAATAGAKAALGNTVCGTAQSSALTSASALLAQNRIDGQAASGAINSSRIQAGNYSSGSFTSCGTPLNAVRASPATTTNNLFGSLWSIIPSGSSHPTSTVTKVAIATFAGLGGGEPNVPLAVCDCAYQSNCFADQCEPSFTHPTWYQHAAWTEFNLGHSTSNIRQFIPAACPQGGGTTPPNLTAGTSTVDVTNGTGSNGYDGVRCMACNLSMCTAASPCLVPVIDCASCPAGPLNGSMPVVGFAEVVIDSFHCTGGGGTNCPCGTTQRGNIDGITFHSVFRVNIPGKPGGGNFGAGFVQLVG